MFVAGFLCIQGQRGDQIRVRLWLAASGLFLRTEPDKHFSRCPAGSRVILRRKYAGAWHLFFVDEVCLRSSLIQSLAQKCGEWLNLFSGRRSTDANTKVVRMVLEKAGRRRDQRCGWDSAGLSRLPVPVAISPQALLVAKQRFPKVLITIFANVFWFCPEKWTGRERM